MPSEYVKDLVDHKTRVAKHIQKVANGLVERIIVKGDILPYSIDGADDEPATLMTLIDVACKLKRDASYGAQFQLSEQGNRIVQNTLAYLVSSPDNTPPCYWIASCVNDLFLRAAVHDNSKFGPDEYEAYEKAFPDLQKYAYGSDEFKAALATIRPAIEHHYSMVVPDFGAQMGEPAGNVDGINVCNLRDLFLFLQIGHKESQSRLVPFDGFGAPVPADLILEIGIQCTLRGNGTSPFLCRSRRGKRSWFFFLSLRLFQTGGALSVNLLALDGGASFGHRFGVAAGP